LGGGGIVEGEGSGELSTEGEKKTLKVRIKEAVRNKRGFGG